MSALVRTWARSFRGRLTLSYLVVVAVLAGAWGWSLASPLTQATLDQHTTALRSVAQAGAVVLAETDGDVQTSVDRIVARTQVRMTIVAADGTVLADSEEDPSSMENHAGRPEIAAALNGAIGEDRRLSETQGTERVYVAIPARFRGDRVVVRVSESVEHVADIAARSRRTGLILLAIALAVSAALVMRLTSIATQPVERLSSAARTMAAGNLTSPVPVVTGDLGVLSTALTDLREQMARRLLDLEDGQRDLREVLDGLTDAVFLLHGLEVQFANRAAHSMFGGCESDWRGADIATCGLPASALPLIGDDAAGSQSRDCGPDPSGRHLRLTTLPLNPGDGRRRSLVVISDITERTQIDHVRRDFVANASHELKTPTAGIHLLAEAITTAAADGDTDQALEFARQIERESARLSHLVSDLLELSRLETTPEPGSVTDVRTSIANALLSHRPAAERADLELTFDDERARGLDAYARADVTDVAIALDNLLDNAIAYTEHGNVRVELAVEADAVRVVVSDTGPGIAAHHLTRIFERFYRVDEARSRENGGTGLGLALVKHVVERSGGSVGVSSIAGEGSTFTVVLRRASSSATAASARPATVPRG